MASAATLPKLLQSRRGCRSYFQLVTFRVSVFSVQACFHRLLVSSGGTGLRHTFHPVSAVGSGRDSSITEAERKSDLSLENVKTSIVSRDDEMINVRVQLPGKATQKIFDEALTFLARDAPPVPGFRKSKGGTEAPHNLSSYDGILA